MVGRREPRKGIILTRKDSWHITPFWLSVPKPKKSYIVGTVAAAPIQVTAPLNFSKSLWPDYAKA
jgi:hypothetical protein